jgi:DNA-binding winged helix-turn-helix (wHTH) protein/tetratricopeptide (TPR) repeat protein
MPEIAHSLYSFNGFLLDLTSGCLVKEGHELKLRPKSFRLLEYLVNNRGRLVRKDELIRALWPDSFVTENSLVKCVNDVRVALGDNSNQIIKTVARRGYIFIGKVINGGSTATGSISAEQTKSIRTVFCPEEIRETCALPTLAVLPFLSLDGGEEYFGLAIADALITRFSKLRRIIVRPMGAVMKYSRLAQDPLIAGRELAVDLVLEGSIQRAADKLRVTARLISVRDRSPVWAEQLHEKLSDIFKVQDSISIQIAEAVIINLTEKERTLLTRRHTKAPKAYDAYLKGRYFWNQMSEESLRKAIELFEQAIACDPGYAMAYAGVADCYLVLGSWAVGAMRPSDAYPKAKSAALRALQLEPMLAEAHTSMAAVIKVFDWNWEEAERGFKRAIEIDPSYPTAHQWYAMYLSAMGRLYEATEEIHLAHGLAPLSHAISKDLARVYFFARQYQDAIKHLEQTLELEPHFVPALFFLGIAYGIEKRYEESQSILRKAVSVSGGKAHLVAALGHTLAACGQTDAALSILGELRDQSARRYVSPYNFAIIHAGLGHSDLAFTYLEKTYEERSNWLVFLRGEPRLDCLRPDPRFQDLMRRVGLL